MIVYKSERYAMHKLLAIIFTSVFLALGLTSCERNQQSAIDSSRVKNNIALKKFMTGQVISNELKQATLNSKSWTFFGQRRRVEVETLVNGTVVSIKFPLDSWYEGYKLKDSLEAKFKEEGNIHFAFNCTDSSDSVELGDKRFSVRKDICTAVDGRQVLEIKSQHLIYEEPFFKLYPSFTTIVDFANVNLYDKDLLKVKEEEKNVAAAKLQEAKTLKNEREKLKANKDL